MEKGHLGIILSFPLPFRSANHGISHYDIWSNGLFALDHGEIENLGSWDKCSNYYIAQLCHFLHLA